MNFGTRTTATTLALLLFGLAATPSIAAIQVDPDVRQLQPTTNLRIQDGDILLSIEEAIEIALERNLTLIVDRHRQDEADLSLRRTFGIYDVNTTINTFANEENAPAASNLDGANVQSSQFKRFDVSFDKLVALGGRGQLDINNSRLDTNSTFATLNPSFRVDFDLSWTQPLLRDFGRKATERNIRVARTNQAISRETFESQVIATVQLVEDAYWTLVEAIEQFRVAEESLRLAKQLHEQNRIRVDVGTLAPLELIQSEAGVAGRDEQIIRARGAIGDAEDRLRQLLNLQGDDLWSATIVPETDAEMEPIELDLETAIATALARRPDLRSKRISQGDLEQDVDYFRNQQLPRLDLGVTYGFNGQGGDATERDFLTGVILRQNPGEFDDAWEQIGSRDFEGWNISMVAAFPIQNRSAKSQVALAEVNLERGDAELADQELGVITAVRRLARFVDTAAQARESARVSRRLEQENLEAEQKRYENGMSTSFQVLQIQEDLTEARQREVNAITGYRKAVVLYHQATGELLDTSGVEIVSEQ
jgi:outer membrane protein TolC